MGTINLTIQPAYAGDVTVNVSGGTLNDTRTATTFNPLEHEWTVDPGSYSVTISWSEGFQNISNDLGQSSILVNGQPIDFMVVGRVYEYPQDFPPAERETQWIGASFSFNVD